MKMLNAHPRPTTRFTVLAGAALAIAFLAGPVTAKDAIQLAPGSQPAVTIPKNIGKAKPKPPMVKPVPKVVPAAPKINPDIIPKLKVVPPQANAATCKQYALEAMTMISQAKQMNCQSLAGPRWLNDYNAHYNWCMTGVPKNVLQSETNARIGELAGCTSGGKK